MKTAFRNSFAKDLKRHAKDNDLLSRIQEIVLEVEAANSISLIKNMKKLKAEGLYYRIRAANYRIGLIIDGEIVTFVRDLHRREIYRHFP